jgi:hypothetical protein
MHEPRFTVGNTCTSTTSLLTTGPRLPLQVRTTQLVLGSGEPTTMPPPLRAPLVPSRALEAAGKLAGKMRHQDNAAL